MPRDVIRIGNCRMPAMQVSIFVLLPPHLKRWKHRIRIVPLDLGRCCLNLEGEISMASLPHYNLQVRKLFWVLLFVDSRWFPNSHISPEKKYNILKLGSPLLREKTQFLLILIIHLEIKKESNSLIKFMASKSKQVLR